jgi:hypothetical protein
MVIVDRFSLGGRIKLATAGAGLLFGRSISEGLAKAGTTSGVNLLVDGGWTIL